MTDKKKFIIGARGSKLSLAYSNFVKNLLIKSSSKFDNSSIEIKIIKTSGDIFQNKRISDIGGKGVFCKQIEEELLDSKIDLAVHSLKDLPTQMTRGLCVNAVMKRNDPRDAFLSNSNKSFQNLKPHSKIGTSSFRRHAQLNLLRNDLEVVSIRGNIDTVIANSSLVMIASASNIFGRGLGSSILRNIIHEYPRYCDMPKVLNGTRSKASRISTPAYLSECVVLKHYWP